MPKKLTNEQVKEKIKNLTDDNFIWISGEYISSKKPINVLHKKCNTISHVSLNYIGVKGKNCCHYCNQILVDQRKRLTDEQYRKQFYSLYSKDEYELLDKYIDDKTKIRILCHKCNNIFLSRPNDAKQGYMCPNCRSSKGEKAIVKWLKDNNYEFFQYYSFKDLYYKSKSRPLKFDFKVNIDDTFILIEFDGEQHYKKDRCFHKDTKRYEEQLKRDRLKDVYCKTKNYQLIRITYDKLKIINEELENIFSDIYANME